MNSLSPRSPSPAPAPVWSSRSSEADWPLSIRSSTSSAPGMRRSDSWFGLTTTCISRPYPSMRSAASGTWLRALNVTPDRTSIGLCCTSASGAMPDVRGRCPSRRTDMPIRCWTWRPSRATAAMDRSRPTSRPRLPGQSSIPRNCLPPGATASASSAIWEARNACSTRERRSATSSPECSLSRSSRSTSRTSARPRRVGSRS